MSTAVPWSTTAKQICESLADGLDVAGTIETADIFTKVGTTCLEIVIEASDIEGHEQVDSYRVLCDLLDTRLATGAADEIIGCLLLSTEPDAAALHNGLTHMTRANGQFVPVLPLSPNQAYAIADCPLELADFADEALALIGATAANPTRARMPQKRCSPNSTNSLCGAHAPEFEYSLTRT